MAIALIAVGAIVAICSVVEVVLGLIACHERNRFDNLPPVAQRKYQEDMYKVQTKANS